MGDAEVHPLVGQAEIDHDRGRAARRGRAGRRAQVAELVRAVGGGDPHACRGPASPRNAALGVEAMPVPMCRQVLAKRANTAAPGHSGAPGTHFAHSVTILLSVIDRFVGPQSVQSGRMVSL